MGDFAERIDDIKAETFNQLSDTVQAQAREIRRLEAIISGASPEQAEKQMDSAVMEFSGLIASKNKQPYVQIKWGASVVQLTIEEARDHALTILSIAEAARIDALFYQFALALADGDESLAMPLIVGLRDFREKQGGR